MSEVSDVSSGVPTPVRGKNRRKILLAAAALVFIALAAGYAVYWVLIGRFDVSTDDAYVNGNVVILSPQIAGTVTVLKADDTDYVSVGQDLVDLDDSDTRLAMDHARAQLAQTVRDVRALYAQTDALAASVQVEKTKLNRAREDLARRQRLANTGAVSSEELKHARDAVDQATAELSNVQKQWEASQVLTADTTLPTHPRVALAEAQFRAAYLAWRRTVVRAPVSGQVAKRSVQVGQQVQAGKPLMAIVPMDQVWVDANFKEGQLTHVRIGQPVVLTADLYGSDVTYHGTVVGLSAGTGSAFSLLPAQNATGNWIKVVQRLPVRIALNPDEVKAHPLRIGLSMQVDVTIRDQSGAQLSTTPQADVVAQTAVYSGLDKGADQIIRSILESAGPAKLSLNGAVPSRAATE